MRGGEGNEGGLTPRSRGSHQEIKGWGWGGGGGGRSGFHLYIFVLLLLLLNK